MKKENENNYRLNHDPTGAAVQMVKEICSGTGLDFEYVLAQFPDFISKPVRDRLASEKNNPRQVRAQGYNPKIQ